VTPGKDLPRAAAAAAHLSGSGPIELDDVVRPAALLAKLHDPQHPVGAYLRRRFTAEVQTLVAGYDGSDPPPATVVQAVVDELNRLLRGDDLWNELVFATVPMRDEVRTRLRRPTPQVDRAWTNRFRLEVALPELMPRPMNRLEQAGIELFAARDRPAYEATIERRMHGLESLSVIDDATRDGLWDPVLIGAHFAAILEVQKAALRRRLNFLALCAVALIVLFMPAVAWRLAGRPVVAASDAVKLLLYVTIMAAVLMVISLLVAFGSWLNTRLLLRRVHATGYYAIAFVSWPGLVMAYSVFEIRTALGTGTVGDVITAAGLLAADGLWLVLLLWIGLREAGVWGLERWFEEDHADAVIVDGLLTCLVRLDGPDRGLWSLDGRQELAAQLERIAACIERVLPRRFEGRAGADPWVAQSARELAFGMRKLKRWVATPLTDTAERLVTRLRTDLVHAAAGAWGHLERCAEEPASPITAVPRVRQLVTDGARTLVIAALPLIGVWFAGPYGLGEPLRTQLLVSAAAWAVLTILLYLDPNSSRQLAALREAIPFGKGKD